MNNKHNFDRNKNDGKIILKEADKDQSSFLVEIMNFKSKTKPQNPGKKQRKKIFSRTLTHFLMIEKDLLMLLKAKVYLFQI